MKDTLLLLIARHYLAENAHTDNKSQVSADTGMGSKKSRIGGNFLDYAVKEISLPHLQQVRERGAGGLPVAPQSAAHVLEQLAHDRGKMRVQRLFGVVHQSAPDVRHGIAHAWIGVVLVPVQLGNQDSNVGLQLLPCQLRN